MPPPHIEGFYYDENKKKYFKISKDTDFVSVITPYSVSSIRRKARLKRTLEMEVPIVSKKADSGVSNNAENQFYLAASISRWGISQVSPWMNTSFSVFRSKDSDKQLTMDKEIRLQKVIKLFRKHYYDYTSNCPIMGILPIPGNSKILVNTSPGNWGSLQFGDKPLPIFADQLLSQSENAKLLWYRAHDTNLVLKLESGAETKVVTVSKGTKVLNNFSVRKDDALACDFNGTLATGNGRAIRIQASAPVDATSGEISISGLKTNSDIMTLEMVVVGPSRLIVCGLRDGYIQFWSFERGCWLAAGKTFFGSTVTQIASFYDTSNQSKDVYLLVSGLKGRLKLYQFHRTPKGTIDLKKVIQYLNYNNDFTLGDCFHIAPYNSVQYGFFAICDSIERCIKIYRFLDALPIASQQSTPQYLKIPFVSSSITHFAWISLREAYSYFDNGLVLDRASKDVSNQIVDCGNFSLRTCRRLLSSDQELKGYSFNKEPYIERFALLVNEGGDHSLHRVSLWF